MTLAAARQAAARCERSAPLLLAVHTNRGTLFGVRSLLGAVALEAPANDVAIPQVKWINVANEGEYLGHHQGGFALTPEIMGQLVANLRASPKYKLGKVSLPDGSVVDAGSDDVVQYDYEHASEMAPWEGSIPVSGAPAMGWVWDLEIRQGADGRSQLWALSWLGDQIRGQIQRREYKWVSIAWNPEGVHWQSGEDIGAVLTSIAFTNHPFLQDLADVAARTGFGTAGQAARSRLPSREHAAEAYAASARAPSNPNPGSSPMAADSNSTFRTRLCTVYRVQEQADDGVIIRAAENAAAVGGHLAAVLTALGVTDPEAAIAAAGQLPAVRAQLQSVLAELDGLGRADAQADETVAQTDVAAALSARGWVRGGFCDPNLLVAVQAHRKTLVDGEIARLPKDKSGVGDQRLARERGRLAFLAAYGVNQNPATQHLTTTFVAGPGPGASGGSTQFPAPLPAPGVAVPVMYAQPGALAPVPGLPAQAPGRAPLQLVGNPGGGVTQLEQVDLSGYSGRNTTERVMSYLSSRDQGFEKLERGQKVRRASEWRRVYEAQFGPIAA